MTRIDDEDDAPEPTDNNQLYLLMRKVQVPNLIAMTWPSAVLLQCDPEEIIGIVHGLDDERYRLLAIYNRRKRVNEEREWNRLMAL